MRVGIGEEDGALTQVLRAEHFQTRSQLVELVAVGCACSSGADCPDFFIRNHDRKMRENVWSFPELGLVQRIFRQTSCEP